MDDKVYDLLEKLYTEVQDIKATMATKEELQEVKETMATKEELQEVKATMATKEELQDIKATMATKEELQEVKETMATKEELQEVKATMATKEDIKWLEEQLELVNKDVKAEIQMVYDEVINLKEDFRFIEQMTYKQGYDLANLKAVK
jgi:hypothetical protein